MKAAQVAAAFLLVLAPFPLLAQQSAPPAKSAPTRGVNTAFAHEQAGWDALKAGDIAAFNKAVNGTFTYIDPNGIVAWTPKMSEGIKDCTLTHFTSEDVHTQQPAAGIVVLSYKATLDQTCKGTKAPSPIYVLSVWQRSGPSWRMIAHSETTAAPKQ